MPKETQSGSVRFRHDNQPGAPSAQRRGERVALVVALITLCFAIAGCAGSSPAGARPAPPPRATSAPSRPTTTEGQLTLRVRQAVGSAAKQVDLAYQAADGAAVVTVTLVWSPAWKVDFAKAQSVAKTVCYETQATLWTSGVALSKVTVTVLGQALDDYSDVITSAYAAATLTASHASAIQWPAITADEAWTRYDFTFMRPTYNPDWIYPPPATPTPQGPISMSSDVAGMTLDQQVGQLFMVGFHGAEPSAEIIELIQRRHAGGIILFSRNCQSARQVARLTRDLQDVARAAGHRYPLLIAIDQENGLVHRMGDAITELPGAMALGATRSEGLTFAVAEATGQELRTLGVNMNLAPVADVNKNPTNPVINVRSFGEDPRLVARLTAAAVRGYRAAGVISTLKHFPGHGDTVTDSHLALPELPHALERLEQVEFPPFRAGVAANADAVMLAHLSLPQVIQAEGLPASLSATIVRLLRQSLGFTGVILTDCLEMGAIARSVGATRGAILALRAGVDIALISHTIEAQRGAIEGVRAAVASGELAEGVIRMAAKRVLALKERSLSWDRLPGPLNADTASFASHQRLRDAAYRRSATLVRDDARLLPARLPPTARIIVIAQPPAGITKANDRAYSHEALVDAVRRRHANTHGLLLRRDFSETTIARSLNLVDAADLLIVATINAHLDERQANLIQRLIATGRPIIGVALCDPYDVAALPQLPTYLATYEYTTAALSAVADAIFGVFEPLGRLPISVS